MRLVIIVLTVLFMSNPSFVKAQTNYVKKSGFYSSVLPNFKYHKASFDQRTFIISPNIGYRINKSYDILLSMEYLNHQQNIPAFATSEDPGEFTNLTFSLIFGQTLDVLKSQKLSLRNQAGFTKSLTVTRDEIYSSFDLSPQGAFISSSLFKEISIFKNWIIYPNAGLELSFNDFDNPFLEEEDFIYLEEENNLFLDIGIDIRFPLFSVPFVLQPSYQYSVANNNRLNDRNSIRLGFFFNF